MVSIMIATIRIFIESAQSKDLQILKTKTKGFKIIKRHVYCIVVRVLSYPYNAEFERIY